MAARNPRTIAPKRNMSAHAQMLNISNGSISPNISTPIKQELQSTSPYHAETPSWSGQPTVRDSLVSTSPRAQPIASQRSESDGGVTTSRSSGSPRLKLHLTPRHVREAASRQNEELASSFSTPVNSQSSFSSSSGSGLKLKLRGIQAALRGSPEPRKTFSPLSAVPFSRKRSNVEASLEFDDDDDTDSEIDIMPPSRKIVKQPVTKSAARTTPRKAKKAKVAHEDSDYHEDSAFDAGDENSSPTHNLVLSSNVLKRSERILDPNNPEHAALIAAAPKAGPEYYDSDAEDLPGNAKDTSKPHLFRNVSWGTFATDHSDPDAFTTEPEFTQFVPGRYERLPNGTAFDQKHKLIIKLTDTHNRQRIFLNPPPRDWTNQAAITALNKRTVQQIRRNTGVRFREVVEPYVNAERKWILSNLKQGKPEAGWKKFVEAFNREFEGKVVAGEHGVRPRRSHSSLTKEVERFGQLYARGLVPRTGGGKVKSGRVEKGGKGRGGAKEAGRRLRGE